MVLFGRAHHWPARLATFVGLRQFHAVRYARRFADNTRENLFCGVDQSFDPAAASAATPELSSLAGISGSAITRTNRDALSRCGVLGSCPMFLP